MERVYYWLAVLWKPVQHEKLFSLLNLLQRVIEGSNIARSQTVQPEAGSVRRRSITRGKLNCTTRGSEPIATWQPTQVHEVSKGLMSFL